MTDSSLKNSDCAYLSSIDNKLSKLKTSQNRTVRSAHTLWECIALLNSAIYNKIQGIEYLSYFELIKNTVIEYGLANIVVCNASIKEHLEDLKERINQKEIA